MKSLIYITRIFALILIFTGCNQLPDTEQTQDIFPTSSPVPTQDVTPTLITTPISVPVSVDQGLNYLSEERELSILIQPGGLSKESNIKIEEIIDPSSNTISPSLGEVYSIELPPDVDILEPIQLALKLPKIRTDDLFRPHVMRWTGHEWEFIDSYVLDEHIYANVTELSTWSVGYKTEIYLERENGGIEHGDIIVERDDDSGDLYVSIYDANDNLIQLDNVQDFRGGYVYHEELPKYINWASIISEVITHRVFPIPINTFLISLIEKEYALYTKLLDTGKLDTSQRKSTNWSPASSSCYVSHGYNASINLNLQYGIVPAFSSNLGGPFLELHVLDASDNLLGDTVIFYLFYDGELIKAFKMDSVDLKKGYTHIIDLHLHLAIEGRSNLELDKIDLLAMIIGKPDVMWFEVYKWDLWKDTTPRSLCVLGGDSPDMSANDSCDSLQLNQWGYELVSITNPPGSILIDFPIYNELWIFEGGGTGRRIDNFSCERTFTWSCTDGSIETRSSTGEYTGYHSGVVSNNHINGFWTVSSTELIQEGTWVANVITPAEWQASMDYFDEHIKPYHVPETCP